MRYIRPGEKVLSRKRKSVLLKFTSGQVTYDENSFLTPLV